VRCDTCFRVSNDGDAEKGQRHSFLLQDEALLLRKQALLQESEPRLLHWRSRERHMLLQERLMSDAKFGGTHVMPVRLRATPS
jgi:hypothetical protein